MESTLKFINTNKLLTAAVASVATLIFSMSWVGIAFSSKRHPDLEEEEEGQVNQSFDHLNVLPETPLLNQDGDLVVSVGNHYLTRRHSPPFTSFQNMIARYNSVTRTIFPECNNYSRNSNIKMAVDPLSTATSSAVSADAQAGQEHLMRSPETLSSSAAQNVAATNSEPNIEGVTEQEHVPGGGFQNNQEVQYNQRLDISGSAEVASYELKRTDGTGWVRLDSMRDEDINLFD